MIIDYYYSFRTSLIPRFEYRTLDILFLHIVCISVIWVTLSFFQNRFIIPTLTSFFFHICSGTKANYDDDDYNDDYHNSRSQHDHHNHGGHYNGHVVDDRDAKKNVKTRWNG